MTTHNVNLTRGRDGWEAKTDVPLDFLPGNRVLAIHTSKSGRGGVSANGTVMTIEKDTGSGYSGRSFILFQDFSKTLAFDRTVRTTEKTVSAIHAQALAALPDTLAAIRAHYKIMEPVAA